MSSDGSVVIDVDLNTNNTEKELKRLKNRIRTLEDQAYVKQKQKMPLVEQSRQLAAVLDEAKAKLEAMQNGTTRWYTQVQIKEQAEAVRRLQKEWDGVQNKVDGYDAAIQKASLEINLNKERAGALQKELLSASVGSEKMAISMKKAHRSATKFSLRLKEVVRSALIFTVISQGFAALREWSVNVIKTNDKAVAAIAKLKAALLTLAQPLVDVIIPTLTALINLLTRIIMVAAQIVSGLFGTTVKDSADAAENLNDEQEALEGVGDAAKEAGRSLASFDEINQLSGSGKSASNKDDDKIKPDFSGLKGTSDNWLSNILGDAAGWVTAALMLGGIALVAIGAATGQLPLVITGLVLLGAGLFIGSATGVLQSWVDTLGLNNVQEFVVLALLLAGIAIVAIGAAMGNILMVIAGLALVGTIVAYVTNSGMLKDWADSLGLAKAAQYVTAALLIGGAALVVIGAITKNYLMVAAGIGLLAAGIFIGEKSGVFKSWWEALELSGYAGWATAALIIGGIALIVIGAAMSNILMVMAGLALLAAGVVVGVQTGVLKDWAETLGLKNVFHYVVAGMQLGGLALLAIGAAMGNIFMVIAGLVLLSAGIIAENVGEKTLKNFWEKLKLTNVQQWVSVALLLVGIALIAIGAVMGNVFMVIAGATMLFFGGVISTQNNNLADWVTVLGLEKVAFWVTTALLLAGIGFIFFGIVTKKVLMVVAGVGMLVTGVVIGNSTGTFKNWWDALGLPEVAGWVSTALLLGGIALVAFGAATSNIPLVIAGLGLLGAGAVAGLVSSSKAGNFTAGRSGGFGKSTYSLSMPEIPALATGAVIPPNNEFLAVLGDQKHGTNIEVPEGLLRQIFREESGKSGGVQRIELVLKPKPGFARYLSYELDEAAQNRGIKLVKGAVMG